MLKNKWFHVLASALIIFSILLVFGKVVHFGFILFDDNILILGSFSYIKNISNILNAFVEDIFHGRSYFYRPILTVSFIFNAQTCGLNAFCYHVTNLILHIIFALVLYAFLIKLGIKKLVSLLLSILFSVHPVVISNVGWINGRVEILLGIFFLAAFIFFEEWQEKGQKRNLLLHALFFNLALYTKEIAFLLVPLILLYSIIVKKNKVPRIQIFLIWCVSTLIWLFLRFNAVKNSSGLEPGITLDSILKGTIIYIGKVFPLAFSVYPTSRDSNFIPGMVTIAVLLLLFFWFRKRWRELMFASAWFVVLIVPACLKLGSSDPVYFEHRLYLPLVGLFIGAGTIVSEQLKYQKILLILCAFLIPLSSAITFARLDYYKDDISFWNRAMEDAPHSADALRSAGYIDQYVRNNPQRASELYRKAIELDPKVTFARPDLAVIYINNGKYAEAERVLLEDLEIRNTDYSWLQLGRVYYAQGNLNKAHFAWKNAYKLNPNFLPVNINLALIYSDMRDYKEAKKYYLRSIELGGLESGDKNYLQTLKFLELY